MKIGGTPPPGGDNFRIPDPEGSGPKKTGGSGKSGFQEKLDGPGDTPNAAGAAGSAAGTQASKLREILGGKVDTSDPAAVEQATDKMVDWVLSERFGEGFSEMKGAADLRKAVRDELLGDPNGSSQIKQILDKL